MRFMTIPTLLVTSFLRLISMLRLLSSSISPSVLWSTASPSCIVAFINWLRRHKIRWLGTVSCHMTRLTAIEAFSNARRTWPVITSTCRFTRRIMFTFHWICPKNCFGSSSPTMIPLSHSFFFLNRYSTSFLITQLPIQIIIWSQFSTRSSNFRENDSHMFNKCVYLFLFVPVSYTHLTLPTIYSV